MNCQDCSKDVDIWYNLLMATIVNTVYDYIKGEISIEQVVSILERIESILLSRETTPPN